MTNAQLAEQIMDRAAAAHCSMNKLMKKAGVHSSTVWRWRTGKVLKAPHPHTIAKINDALDAFERERGA